MNDNDLIKDQIDSKNRIVARLPVSLRAFATEIMDVGRRMGLEVDFEIQVRADRPESEYLIIIEDKRASLIIGTKPPPKRRIINSYFTI